MKDIANNLSTNRVSDNIDKLINAELETHPERLVAFFVRLQSNYDDAIRTATRYFLLGLSAWFLTYAISAGWTENVTFIGFKLDRKMIVVSPFLVGLLMYGLLSAFAGAVVLWEAISRGVFHLLPTAWNHSLDDLLAPPTFSNVERMLEPSREKKFLSFFSRAWFGLVTLLMFGGSLVALIHTTYLFFTADPPTTIRPVFGVVSALLGAIAWLRGVVLFKSAIEATGGSEGESKLGHHRASGRVGVDGPPVTDQRLRDDLHDFKSLALPNVLPKRRHSVLEIVFRSRRHR